MTDDLNSQETVTSICSTLHGKIRPTEEALLLLRLLEFCTSDALKDFTMFQTMAEKFHIPQEQYNDFLDFVSNKPTEHIKLHHIEGFDGTLKTLLDNTTGLLIFTYLGKDTVLLNDVPVLAGAYQVWIQSSVLKNATGKPVYYSSIIDAYSKEKESTGKRVSSSVDVTSISDSPTVTMACTT